jgi:hypothetical protein
MANNLTDSPHRSPDSFIVTSDLNGEDRKDENETKF